MKMYLQFNNSALFIAKNLWKVYMKGFNPSSPSSSNPSR